MKVDRAAEHLARLQRRVDETLSNEPFAITRYDLLDRGLHVFRAELKPSSPDIPLSIGEFAYCLRSALDNLAWQLALLVGEEPPRSTAFPIHHNQSPESQVRFQRATAAMPEEAVAIIRDLQPYQFSMSYRVHPLWQLNTLCNLDKHATMAVNSTAIDIETGPPSDTELLFREGDYWTELAIPIEQRDETYFRPRRPEMIFGRPVDVPGPLFELRMPDLVEMEHFVRAKVVSRFEPFFASDPHHHRRVAGLRRESEETHR